MRRLWEIDALRGLMLVLMTLTHLPTRLTDPLGQPFGWVSAAEGFVLLSGFTAGLVYSRVARERGVGAMERAFWKRAFKVYLAQAATLLFLFTVITRVGLRIDQPAVKDLVSYYLAHPQRAIWSGLLLLYEPALLDILPMYVLFMLVSPPVLALGMRRGWGVVMAASAAIWLGAQFGLSEWIYGWTVALTHMELPFHEMGAFNTLAWQLLWCGGLWLGASRSAPNARPWHLPDGVVTLAIGVAVWGLLWRHLGEHGQAPFGADIQRNLWFDKWQLGPLRLLNLLALCILAVRFGPALVRWLPRPRVLEVLGAASLPVFCAHLVAVLLTLTLFGDNQFARPWWGDALLLAVVFGGLYAVARLTLWLDRRGRAARKPQAAPR